MPPAAPQKLVALAEACWHQDPEQRPEFSEVIRKLIWTFIHVLIANRASFLVMAAIAGISSCRS
jgi:hypothetical protein